MTITTLGTASHITPTVISTFIHHYFEQAKKRRQDRHLEATDELLFHEAFSIVKRFISLATNDTVESLQAFTNTRIPAPPRTSVVSDLIPLSSCDRAAKAIIDYFGPEDLKNVVGGEKWWQVRGLNGVEAEWVAMTSDWKKAKIVEEMPDGDAKVKTAKFAKYHRRHERKNDKHVRHDDDDAGIEELDGEDGDETVPVEELDRLRRCLLYFHGGGFYFGSAPTTHRYQIVRLARKMGGRAFAPTYRKAPGYPWPAPLQDCLAAYFYLIDPPPEARHKAIDPKNIIFGGDSAGGGMCLAVLAVLRDLGLPMPAGCVLISPWCDLTHSFPSILQNTASDIIPQYGFVHKPSTLWPVPSNVHANESQEHRPSRHVPQDGAKAEQQGVDAQEHGVDNVDRTPHPSQPSTPGGASTPATAPSTDANGIPPAPSPLKSKIIDVDLSNGERFELKRQIQLYATNDQLYHPLCSPVFQGSLGGLPPLYIIAGDGEVLRDEVIMLAHRAARPEKYPLPEHLLAKNARARETAARFNSQPTKVHLQVFDYQCHVLTLFPFTTAARYAYRAAASFAKHVTRAQTTLVKNPFPELREEPSVSSSVFSGRPSASGGSGTSGNGGGETGSGGGSGGGLVDEPEEMTPAHSEGPSKPGSISARARGSTGGSSLRNGVGGSDNGSIKGSKASARAAEHERQETILAEKRRKATAGVANDYSGQVPLKRPDYYEHMIRERVNVRGAVRPLEAEEELQSIRLFVDHPQLVGAIREGPVKRYLEGQGIWDKRFRREAKKVEKRRKDNEARCEEMLRIAMKRGLIGPNKASGQARPDGDNQHKANGSSPNDDSLWVDEARYGPVDVALAGETPPPSALAGRRDCDDAVTLLRLSLHLSAREAGIGGKRARIREDVLGHAPKLSAAEASQAAPKKSRPGMHGMSLWTKWMGAFGKRTRKDPYFEDRSKETAEEAEAGDADDDDDGARASPEDQ